VTAQRVLLCAVGAVAVAVGLDSLLDVPREDLVETLWWLAGGVVLHDAVLAPLTLVVGLLAARLLPSWAFGAVAAGFLVLASVTLIAVPVLGRFGASPSNPTLLDRDYWAGWAIFVATVLAATVTGAVVARLRARQVPGIGGRP
jgi:hypothetical protein